MGPTRLSITSLAAGMVAALSVAVFLAAPWLDQRLVPAVWLGVAAALVLTTGRRGWRHESLVLLAVVIALAAAFHWTPTVLAEAMRTTWQAGVAFAVPIVLWDACRIALPFWVVGRVVRDPRSAWLPAALVAVVTEAFVPAMFPWKIGYAQTAWPVTMQAADLLGVEGPTFALFAHAGTIVVLLHGILGGASVGGRGPWRIPAAGIAAVAVSVANLAYGAWAIDSWTRLAAAAPTVRLAVVQVDPERDGAIDELRRLSRAAAATSMDRGIDLVCWPECSGGSYEEGLESFADEAVVHRRSRPPFQGLRPLPDPPCPLLLGGKVYRGYPEKPRDIYQSALLIDERERLAGCYHKRHLMPFGEYVPAAGVIPELRLHFPMDIEFDVGTAPDVLACGSARLGVMLCYEDMVPEAAASLVQNSANLLVSLVNGSAFTEPLTLAQHRLLAQGRAVENRRCLVRCSATGETCVISPVGTIDHRLPITEPGVLVVDVPLLEARTAASSLGWLFPWACGAALVAAALRRGLGRGRQAQPSGR